MHNLKPNTVVFAHATASRFPKYAQVSWQIVAANAVGHAIAAVRGDTSSLRPIFPQLLRGPKHCKACVHMCVVPQKELDCGSCLR